MEYTKQEIETNINTLSNILAKKKLQRTELSQEINKLKKDIIGWQSLDLSQLKLY